MAIYGVDFYGISFYGANTLVDFDASPFLATSTDYNEIELRWTEPSGSWSTLRLLRNPFGFPMTPDDGDLLVEAIPADDVTFYLDRGQVPSNSGLIPGHTYYYSIFVKETVQNTWVKAGESIGVSVKNYGTKEQFYDYLPAIFKIKNTFSASDNDDSINDDLYNFLSIFAIEHDLFKTSAQNVSERYDILNLDGRLVPPMLNQFGLKYEPYVGLQQARILLRNAVKIYSEKGSVQGLKTYVTAFSGYNCRINPITNYMLDVNSSSFKESTGFWRSVSNATLAQGTLESETPSIAPYSEVTSPSNYPNGQAGFLKVTANSAADVEIACGTLDVRTLGIPVQSGRSYTLSAYSRAKTTARNVVLDIRWYDANETLLGTAGESGGLNTTGGWTRPAFSTSSAPANAKFAIPYIRIEGCSNGEVHYIDAVQFENSAEPTNFVDARRTDIVLISNRVNLISNPSFEVNTSGWMCSTSNATLSTSATGALDFSTTSLTATPTSSGTVTIETDSFAHNVVAGSEYSLSFYAKRTGTATTATANISWYTEGGTFISTSSGTSTNLNTAFGRVSVTATAPSNAVHAKVSVSWAGGTGNVLFVDAVLFERASYVGPYFDGAGGYQQTSDLVWEGTPGLSRSHYYKNRALVQNRLAATVGEFITHGTPWAIFVAQPD